MSLFEKIPLTQEQLDIISPFREHLDETRRGINYLTKVLKDREDKLWGAINPFFPDKEVLELSMKDPPYVIVTKKMTAKEAVSDLFKKVKEKGTPNGD